MLHVIVHWTRCPHLLNKEIKGLKYIFWAILGDFLAEK